MKYFYLALPFALALGGPACASNVESDQSELPITMESVSVDPLAASFDRKACVPYCFDVRYSDTQATIFMVSAGAKERVVGQYTPDWTKYPNNRPAAGQWSREILLPVPNFSKGAEGQESARIWTAQTDLQPGRPESDRLLDSDQH